MRAWPERKTLTAPHGISAWLDSLRAQWKLLEARLVLCSLDGERMVGNDDTSVLASSDHKLDAHYKIAVSAFSLT